MKRLTTNLLLAAAALSQTAKAGDTTHWATTTCWSTIQEPTTVWSVSTYTETKTSTQLVPTTIVTTSYQTVPTTVVSVQTQPTTIVSIQTQPTTIVSVQTQPTTVVSVQTQPVTVYVTATASKTIVSSETIYNTVSNTIYNTVSNTVTKVNTQYSVSTALSVQYSTVTVVNSLFVTQAATCPTYTSLVTCTSRIINPTYTPPAPLPSNYRNGCPPGYLCQPPKENCNFEQNTFAKSYICPPEQCHLAGPLPSLQQLAAIKDGGPNCAWLTPVPGYANLDPRPWGYTYAIFNIFGQPQCSAQCPLASTVTGVSVSSASAPPSSTSSTTKSSTSSTSSTWGDWSQAAPEVTARAVLQKRDIFWPGSCYDTCNYVAMIWTMTGSDPAICASDSGYSSAFRLAQACSVSAAADAYQVDVSDINDAETFCFNVLNPNKKRMADTQLAVLASSSETVAPMQPTSPANTVAQATAAPGTASGSSPTSSTVTYTAPSPSSNSADRATGKTSIYLAILSTMAITLFSI